MIRYFKMKKMKKKFDALYPKMAGVACRYGMPTNLVGETFIQFHNLESEEFKRTMILNWAVEGNDPIKQDTGNVCIDAMNNLKPIERLIFNMHCIDGFDYEEMERILEIDKSLIIEYYLKAKTKLKNDEKIITYFGDDVDYQHCCDESAELVS